jgi:hypothetical protein
MSTRTSPIRFPAQIHGNAHLDETTFKNFERAAQLLEDLLPNIKSNKEKKLCREVVQRRGKSNGWTTSDVAMPVRFVNPSRYHRTADSNPTSSSNGGCKR